MTKLFKLGTNAQTTPASEVRDINQSNQGFVLASLTRIHYLIANILLTQKLLNAVACYLVADACVRRFIIIHSTTENCLRRQVSRGHLNIVLNNFQTRPFYSLSGFFAFKMRREVMQHRYFCILLTLLFFLFFIQLKNVKNNNAKCYYS